MAHEQERLAIALRAVQTTYSRHRYEVKECSEAERAERIMAQGVMTWPGRVFASDDDYPYAKKSCFAAADGSAEVEARNQSGLE
ncbi:hypothetical protein [Paenibacillus aquistagni]|uniref:hypothetical protein n=1 Tax=Paenibacillus aquistagni TaxID=1852522 RepID=UPI001482C46D|nr:hypothetical protein [Paenibacillus aquistagni]